MTVLRPRAIAVALFAFLFTVNIHSAFATHFRYGTMFWEKNLSAGTATTDTYTVTADVSMRWSFPYGTSPTNFCLSAPGWVPSTGSTTVGQGSCAPLGTVVPLGSIVFNKAVVVNGSSTTAVTFNATIISVSPATDTMFARMTFTVVVTKATNPVLVSWQNNARISTLLEGNADQNYRLETILDHTKGTKSPRSVSLPTLNVTTVVVNEVFIPTVAFDNFSNKLSFATTAQSGLVRPVPGTSTATTADDMTIDLTTPTLVRWTPPISGLYAVQFRITSYDNLGVQKATVPLDLIFHAKPAVPTDPVVSLTTPLTTVIFPIGVVSSFTITSQMTPPTVGFSVFRMTACAGTSSVSVTLPTSSLKSCRTCAAVSTRMLWTASDLNPCNSTLTS